MDRLDYLSDPDVCGFIEYLRDLAVEGNGAVLGIGRGSRRRGVTTLLEAQRAFRWRGRDFAQINRDLETFRAEMHEALEVCMSSEPDCRPQLAQYELLYVCAKILEWANLRKGALTFVTERAQAESLSDCLVRAASLIDGDSDDASAFGAGCLRSGPSVARLYAVMNERTIAYGGRVAAALCLLCRHYLADRGTATAVPELIAFRLVTPGGRHDPSTPQGPAFEPVATGAEHAHWNIRANWLIDALAADHRLAERLGCERRVRLRRLEAALFMVGDDVRSRAVRARHGPRAVTARPSREQRQTG